MTKKLLLLFICCQVCWQATTHADQIIISRSNECVILLHGLTRTKKSMQKVADVLSVQGYLVFNIDYPSRKHTIEELGETVIPKALDSCRQSKPDKIHFITHSLGGILVRYYLKQHPIKNLGRVVMLSPPNQGSEVVDKLSRVPGFVFINGPAGLQLGTDKDSILHKLGGVDYEVGIITGNKSINLILSMLIPGEDDGKVSVRRAKLKGMTDFLVTPHTHPFLMRSTEVIQQSIYFLQNGKFNKEVEEKEKGSGL